MAWIAALCGLNVGWLVASSWPEEFVQRYETHGLALLHNNEADWIQRTNEYGLRRPTRACQIFVYRAFDLWSQMGPMYRATVSVSQFMIPDEILWRIAVYWPDLGNHWHEASWRLHRRVIKRTIFANLCPFHSSDMMQNCLSLLLILTKRLPVYVGSRIVSRGIIIILFRSTTAHEAVASEST